MMIYDSCLITRTRTHHQEHCFHLNYQTLSLIRARLMIKILSRLPQIITLHSFEHHPEPTSRNQGETVLVISDQFHHATSANPQQLARIISTLTWWYQ